MTIKKNVISLLLLHLSYTQTVYALELRLPWQPLRIAALRQHAQEYDENTVLIEGTVISVAKLPLLKMYKLQDDTDSIWVTTDETLPKTQKSIKVLTRVSNLVILFNKNLGLHLNEVQRF